MMLCIRTIVQACITAINYKLRKKSHCASLGMKEALWKSNNEHFHCLVIPLIFSTAPSVQVIFWGCSCTCFSMLANPWAFFTLCFNFLFLSGETGAAVCPKLQTNFCFGGWLESDKQHQGAAIQICARTWTSQRRLGKSQEVRMKWFITSTNSEFCKCSPTCALAAVFLNIFSVFLGQW